MNLLEQIEPLKTLTPDKNLNHHIYKLLKFDAGFMRLPNIDFTDQYLTQHGILDNHGQFCEPATLKGNFRIVAQWLKDNI
jgi:hypothetical protein